MGWLALIVCVQCRPNDYQTDMLLSVVRVGGLKLLLIPFLTCLAVPLTALWIWMPGDCATEETDQGNTKIVWILIIIFTHWLGALIYLLARRPQRLKELGR